jgi:amphi-Trp domain-containing protein
MTRVKLNQAMSAEEAAEQLSHIALGIATGEIQLEADDRSIEFHPGSPMELFIKGEENGEEGKLIVEMSWKTNLRIMGAPPLQAPANRGGS